ncbi:MULTISPECIES: hypothetical protein [unclassified Streptomyces]|uniref:hypothetical protein n=1 Tax=unclassified Streptomyces TaxID=2593676 RepID=UPI0029A686C2|nr:MULTISPECIES: hypothetical protein [unclassified Streptomyces]MDX3772358.1 hypothetical protein [Streptomyces sp. AK08-01B]MDX3821858.1 hypothetical protein [Streptomyces sp. AK08-01A]
MSKNDGARAVTKILPDSAVLHQPTSPDLPGTGRLTVAQALPLTVFPMIGCLLYIVGAMPVPDIFVFLAGCGGVGAVVTIAVTGGRRAMVAIAHGVLAATQNR